MSELAKNQTTKIVAVPRTSYNGEGRQLLFEVPATDNPHKERILIGGSNRGDIYNIANELAEIEEMVSSAQMSNENSQLEYDEEQLQKELRKYIKASNEADKNSWISFQITGLDGARNALLHRQDTAYTDYFKELLTAPNNETADAIKTPFERLPRLQRLGRQDSDLAFNIKNLVKKYTPEQKEFAKKLLRNGYMPSWRELLQEEEGLKWAKERKEEDKKVIEDKFKVIKNFKYIITELDKSNNEIYAQYAKDLIVAKEQGLDLKAVKTPYQQKTWWQQLKNKDGQENRQLINVLELCTPEEFAAIKPLFANGMPTAEQLDTAYDEYHKKSQNAEFNFERRGKLFEMLVKQYGKKLADDRAEAWKCHLNGELPIKGKEKEKFDKMSLKEVAEKYGIEQMWTNKGIILIREKIRTAKDDPKKLAQTLIDARAIVQQESKCFHVPLANRQFFATLIGDEYANLPKQNVKDAQKYGKFSEVDNQFRKLFTALQPTESECRKIEEYRKGVTQHKYGNEKFIEKRLAEFDKFTESLDKILDQSVDITAAKSRLQEKFANKESAAADITGGVIAADRHANDVIELSQNGMHFKESPKLDIQAYKQDVDRELKQKSDNRMKELDKKRKNKQNTR